MEDRLLEMDSIEAEVDEIRRQIYEERKLMTPEERIADLINCTAPIVKNFHIKVSTMKPRKPGAGRRPDSDYQQWVYLE